MSRNLDDIRDGPETGEARRETHDWTDMLFTQAGRSGGQSAATLIRQLTVETCGVRATTVRQAARALYVNDVGGLEL